MLIWFLIRRNYAMETVAIATALLNGTAIIPLFIAPVVNNVINVNDSRLSLLHLNTNRGQANLDALSSFSPDIIFLQEVTPELDKHLAERFPQFEIIHSHPLSKTHGSAILLSKDSSIDFIASEIIHLPETSNRPLIAAEVRWHEQPIQLLNLHMIRPHHAWADAYQKIELASVAQWSLDMQTLHGHDVIIAGDFNTTPWSLRFQSLLRDGELHNSLRGYGLQNTWPSTIPLLFGLPIDHTLHSDNVVTIERATFPVPSTDHAALMATFGFVNR